MAELGTQLRYIRASDPDTLVARVSSLPYKVEIKGNPVKDSKGWIMFYVVADHMVKRVPVNFKNVKNLDFTE